MLCDKVISSSGNLFDLYFIDFTTYQSASWLKLHPTINLCLDFNSSFSGISSIVKLCVCSDIFTETASEDQEVGVILNHARKKYDKAITGLLKYGK